RQDPVIGARPPPRFNNNARELPPVMGRDEPPADFPELPPDIFERLGVPLGPQPPPGLVPPLPVVMARIDSLQGLEAVKEKLHGVKDFLEVNDLREGQGFKPLPFIPHATFVGNEGTGKTTVAKLYAQMLHGLGALSKGHTVEVTREQLMAEILGQPGDKLKDLVRQAKGGVLHIDEDVLLAEGGGGEYDFESLGALGDLLAQKDSDVAVVFTGSEDRLKGLLAKSPKIAANIGLSVPFEDFDDGALTGILREKAREYHAQIPDAVVKKVVETVAKERGGPGFSNARAIERALMDAVLHQSRRLQAAAEDGPAPSGEGLSGLTENDFFPADAGTSGRAQKALEKLDRMTGLKDIKEEVRKIQSTAVLNKLREEQGLPVQKMSNHAFFTGSPGTGKTEVARIMGDLFADAGVLSKGHVVEVDRGGLIGEHVGETAVKAQKAIDRARGGILLIDEAYALAKGGEKDYGHEAVATLMKAMEDNRDDLVVIFTGYTQEMKKLLEMNPGMKSRVQHHLEFKDYSAPEIMEIFERKVADAGYTIAPKAKSAARDRLLKEAGKKKAGNGRAARNLMEAAIRHKALRTVEEYANTGQVPDLRQLEAVDFIKARIDKPSKGGPK
ncbi:MAG TPA: AAA family ATPase, partial [Myxococcaceae bacterium]|nr:AAA family ATPase [Myxococcaceae bacterium]